MGRAPLSRVKQWRDLPHPHSQGVQDHLAPCWPAAKGSRKR
jgi:hypothetical protein